MRPKANEIADELIRVSISSCDYFKHIKFNLQNKVMTNRMTIRIENTSTCMLQARIVPFSIYVLYSLSLEIPSLISQKMINVIFLALQCGCRFQ